MAIEFDVTKFGPLFKQGRLNEEISQDKLAEEMEISSRHLRKIENGQAKPGFELACKLAIRLNISLDLVLGIGANNLSDNELKVLMEIRKLYPKD